ncbi:SigB/SigF/SigG family RNA polymerase sigma factor [Actinoplanes auranticolor]|uniref:STAS domain-containing protein n=1 Tax=Actinoplanes auranticolor TaxID=47988 RepID=A0A919SJ40_9ACTN|nr:SigB/SigF/SigG family RNA polymerase sigma factor [Actinoplanes auranticolor]GIM71903.1 hypothetical protein Aau02nite_48300 [Actinoplanes auranticolor]
MSLVPHAAAPADPRCPAGADGAEAGPDDKALALLCRARDERLPAGERRRARERAIEHHLGLAQRLARRFTHRGQAIDDLVQVAALALVKAVDGFDPALGRPFLAYAVPTITGELKRHFRDKSWDVRVPRRLQERHLEVSRTRVELTQRLHRSPSVTELSSALGLNPAEVREALAAAAAYDTDSLNRPVSADDDACELQDLIGDEDRALECAADRVTVRACVRRLPAGQRHLVNRYFFDGWTQDVIAAELGMSQMNVSRLLDGALRQLRGWLDGTAGVAPDGSRLRVATYPAASGTSVVAVRGVIDGEGAQRLRDALVEAAVRDRPRRLIVDLRHARDGEIATARALVDGLRACGHVRASLTAVNVPERLYGLLRRAGVTGLLPCTPVAHPEPVSPQPVARNAADALDDRTVAVGRRARFLAEARRRTSGPRHVSLRPPRRPWLAGLRRPRRRVVLRIRAPDGTRVRRSGRAGGGR